MERTLNKKKSKLEINSLEYLFVKDLTKHKLNQIRGGYSIAVLILVRYKIFGFEAEGRC